MQVISELISGVRGAELGSVLIYRRGTSTEATVYANYDGAVALAQPLTLDSYGGVEIYVNEEVDVRVADADGTVIRAFSPMQTANSVEYVGPSFTGHRYSDAFAGVNQPTTVQEILAGWITSAGMPDFNVSVGGVSTTIENAIASFASIFINVQAPAYGAVGDGISDDTVAVQAALTAAGTTKGIVFFPAGTYKITAKLTVPVEVSMWGLGAGASALILAHATQSLLEYGAGLSTGFQEIRGLLLTAVTASTGKFVDITTAGNRRVRMVNSVVYGLAPHQGNLVSVDSAGGVNLGVFAADSSSFIVTDPPLTSGCITADNANSRVFLLNSIFFCTGTGTAFNFGVMCRQLKSFGCVYDMSGMTSGAYQCIRMASGTQTAKGALHGNEFIPGSGTSVAIAVGGDTATTAVFESGSLLTGTFTTPFSGFVSNANRSKFQLLTRDSMIRDVTDNTAAVDLNGSTYGTVVLTRTAAGGAQALTSTAGAEGELLTVIVYNNSGGALGANPTVNSGGFYVGNPAITAPGNGKVSVATFRSVVFAGGGAWLRIVGSNAETANF